MGSTAVGITLGSGAIIAAVIQCLKTWIERVLPETDPRHDSTIQLLAAVAGMIGFIAHQASLGPLTGPLLWDSAGQGFLAGLSAVVTFHILSGSTPTIPGMVVTVPDSTTLPQVIHVPPSRVTTPTDAAYHTVTMETTSPPGRTVYVHTPPGTTPA